LAGLTANVVSPLFRPLPTMRIAQIQSMREFHGSYATQRLVALALVVGFIAVGLHSLSANEGRSAHPLTGQADVVDGDTIVIAGTRIRLEGIDAPEAGQICGRRLMGTWSCGTEATRALARLVEGKELGCESHGLDKYGRVLGVCFLGRENVNAWMVRQGYAWAFIKYSSSFVKEEAEARREGAGIWQGDAVPAWEYREQRWARAETQAPQGCAIKGNVTAHGKIYHMPWSPWYDQIKIDPAKGRRWFCSEAEAIAAGWRPVNLH
jgi:endonuclease YncB( thermonuclease family)